MDEERRTYVRDSARRTHTPQSNHVSRWHAFPQSGLSIVSCAAAVLGLSLFAHGQQAANPALASRPDSPPQVLQAQRFLQQRGWPRRRAASQEPHTRTSFQPRASATSSSTPVWQPLGPASVLTPQYGPVTGRITSIVVDPSDSSGNRVLVGTTGGGLWLSQNAASSNAQAITFRPLTDDLSSLGGNSRGATISIGALSVQPGATGIILAGTGDPNDALDSYYGVGILRSTDNGQTWSLLRSTSDLRYDFAGEGFAGFAWSSANPALVVAAVSQSYQGALSDAPYPNASYAGLYYSTDSGATWSLATIQDPGGDVQGPNDPFDQPNGNAATSVVWNPVRKLFLAAVRFHGYYQSTDGQHWTRLSAQPGTGLTTQMCPSNASQLGSVACPIFRGALAVNPVTGDIFAWTVDANNQDQGIWQDKCAISSGVCTNPSIAFATQINSTPLEADVPLLGPVTIRNGDYNLALAAVPSGQDTLLFAGANDLWKCSLAASCVWRNTTNATTCMSAQVALYQHALAWNPSNPLALFLGNDSGLWRSNDAVAESGPVCDAGDATHFQNLNGSLGSLSETESLSEITTSPYTTLAGLGVNGTAGVKSASGPTAQWPQILSGEGGPVAIDPSNSDNWYVNNQAGVSIHRCSQQADCTPSAFGNTPVVTDDDVGGDGYTMFLPAPFLVDPLDPSQLLVATCRLWRGPADGSPWSGVNAISPFLDGLYDASYCNGNALIHTLAAVALPNGSEILYVGMYSSADGGATLAGHLLTATYNPASGTMPAWQDLTFSPVTNDSYRFNANGLDISSISIDPHDPSGQTVYVAVANAQLIPPGSVYVSNDGGAHWSLISSNLPRVPADSIVVDPQDANTVYVGTDAGVYFTRQIATCATTNCWSPYGTGLPQAPAVALRAAPNSVTPAVLVAGTYGRGVWQIPLVTAGEQFTTASVDPSALTFTSQPVGAASPPQTVTFTNTGGIALSPTTITATGDFTETDNCAQSVLNAGAGCSIQVVFTPTQAGTRAGQLTISANVPGGRLTVALSGAGRAATGLSVSPAQMSFTVAAAGQSSDAQIATITNSGSVSADALTLNLTGPFTIAQTNCGPSLAAGATCNANVVFAPAVLGKASGALAVSSSTYASASVALSGLAGTTGSAQITPLVLTFSTTAIGSTSTPQAVTVANTGAVALTGLALTVSSGFQLSGTTCGATLASGASCTAQVAFAPETAGSQSGAFSVTANELAVSQQAALSGTGFDFTANISGASSASVASGQAATFTFSIQPLAGSSGTFTFQCGSLPAYAACAFNPASLTVSANTTGTVQLQISTSRSTSAANAQHPISGRTLAPLLCGLLLVPALAYRRRRGLGLFLLLLLILGAATACAGSGGGTGGSPGGGQGTSTTPTGTYTIPVTITANGLSHSVSVTVTVD